MIGDGWSPVFDLGAFGPGEMSAHARIDAVHRLVETLVYVNRLWLETHRVPPLFHAGVRFEAEPFGAPNYWRDIRRTLELGVGHCVALSAWRIAELRERGEDAKAKILEWHPIPESPNVVEFHVMVIRRIGRTERDEDVSKLLGMP